jgi:hypothetical protein
VPVWLIILSDQLRIVGLVSRYLTNNLIRRRPIPGHPKALIQRPCDRRMSCGISHGFPWLFPIRGQVAYALRTRAPLSTPASWSFSFDLHVLSPPPAFVLSQDQTLHSKRFELVSSTSATLYRVTPARIDRTRYAFSLIKELRRSAPGKILRGPV